MNKLFIVNIIMFLQYFIRQTFLVKERPDWNNNAKYDVYFVIIISWDRILKLKKCF